MAHKTTKTSTTETVAPDLAALVASGAVTIEVIDVATAQLDPNVRTDAVYTAEFVDSIRQDGVREPVYARRGDDGTVYVWDGQRRTLAAKEAGTATMLGIFGLTPATVADSERILDQLRTFNRSDLGQADRLAAYEQLALDGISEAQIARAAGDTREVVKKSITVAKSTTAKQVAKDYGQMSLDKLILIAEFDGDDNAVAAITHAQEDADLPYLAQELRDEAATRQAQAALVAQYVEQGYTVFTDWGGFVYLHRLTDAADDADERPALTDDTHTECPGRAVYLSVWGAEEDDHRTEYVCAQPDNHNDIWRPQATTSVPSHETDEQRAEREAAEAEAKKAERARVIANNKAWRTATTVRRDWIATFLTRKTLPKDTGVFVALSLTTHAQAITENRAGDLVTSFLGQDARGYRSDAAKLVEKSPTKAGHVSLAVALSAREARAEDVQGWRSVSPVIASYLLALESWGYKLSPVERIAAGYTDTPEDPAAEQEPAVDAATEEQGTDTPVISLPTPATDTAPAA